MNRIRIASVLSVVGTGVLLSACGGPTNMGGYATAQEGCKALGGNVAGGIVREKDGREANCSVKDPNTGLPLQVETTYMSDDPDITGKTNTWFAEEIAEADEVGGQQGDGGSGYPED